MCPFVCLFGTCSSLFHFGWCVVGMLLVLSSEPAIRSGEQFDFLREPGLMMMMMMMMMMMYDV